MGKGPKLRLSFLNSIQICRPNHPSTLVKTPLPPSLTLFPSHNSQTYDISIPTLQSPPSSPHHHLSTIYNHLHSSKPTQHDSKPSCTTHVMKSSLDHEFSTREASYSRTKREEKETMHHSPFSSATHLNEQKSIMKKPKAKAVTTDDNFSSSSSSKNSSSNPSEEEPHNGDEKSVKERRDRTRRFKRYGSKDWTEGSTRKLGNEPPEKPVSGRPVRRAVDRQVNESFVVVKRSVNPYEDFKKSMLEMILEREIIEPKDLEQLLMSFLSLNSRMHHKAILKAFSEIWKEVFSRPSN